MCAYVCVQVRITCRWLSGYVVRILVGGLREGYLSVVIGLYNKGTCLWSGPGRRGRERERGEDESRGQRKEKSEENKARDREQRKREETDGLT